MTQQNILYRNIIIQHLAVIMIGYLVFLFDEYENWNGVFTKTLIIGLTIGKILYFIFHSFSKINEAISKNFTYYKFLNVLMINISLMVFSFAVDYFCLYSVDPASFRGIHETDAMEQIFDFVFLSICTFTTFGATQILPNTAPAKLMIILEIVTSFTTQIFILSDFISMKETLPELNLFNKKKGSRRSDSEEMKEQFVESEK